MQTNTVIIQDQLGDQPRWMCFQNPIRVFSLFSPDGVNNALDEIQRYTDDGKYAVGYLSYEAASGLDKHLLTRDATDLPVLWFAIYECFTEIDVDALAFSDAEYQLGDWVPSVTWEEYQQALNHIKKALYDGESYQVNYTFGLTTSFVGDAWQFFLKLNSAQRSKYSAYLDMGRFKVCSVSPELFLSLKEKKLTSLPMKGTAPRAYDNREDQKRQAKLAASKKDQAENVMIVDMIRSDMSAIEKTFNVSTEKLFHVDKYPTVFQMISAVSATTNASPVEILKKMFPCASITGAPKVKTMGIIKQIETRARGLYTGAIGFITPNRRMQFNVAIRTSVVDAETNTAQYGVGAGITWGSNIKSEYQESLSKASVLTQSFPHFDLLETLLWKPMDGYFLLSGHLDRLEDTACYFNFSFSRDHVEQALIAYSADLSHHNYKVRLTLSRQGKVDIQSQRVTCLDGHRVGLSRYPSNVSTPFVFHKTTNRSIYEQALLDNPGYTDIILWNEKKEVTESTIANVVIKQDNTLITPPVTSGLLNGVYRRKLIADGVIAEQVIHYEQFSSASEVYLINSVRGWIKLEKTSDDWCVKN